MIRLEMSIGKRQPHNEGTNGRTDGRTRQDTSACAVGTGRTCNNDYVLSFRIPFPPPFNNSIESSRQLYLMPQTFRSSVSPACRIDKEMVWIRFHISDINICRCCPCPGMPGVPLYQFLMFPPCLQFWRIFVVPRTFRIFMYITQQLT